MIHTLPLHSAQTTLGACSRCEALPAALAGPGTLHLQFPLSHSRGKILGWLREAGRTFEVAGETISIEAAEVSLDWVADFARTLSSTERADARVLWQAEGAPLSIGELFKVETLDAFAARTHSEWLTTMLSNNRLATWFQPIVDCADPKKIFAYECLMRGQDETGVVFPDRILEVARGAGLMFQLDRAARLASIRNAARLSLKGAIFINFTPTSIYDPEYCLRSTMGAIEETDIPPSDIVFEVIESERITDAKHLRGILEYYRERGFRVALDDVGSGYSSLSMLGSLRPDFLKLDRELVSGVHADPYKGTIAAKLLETARALGVKTVAEGVEEAAEFEWLCANGTDYVQGYYFARPSANPPVSFE